jgi:histidine phosphotransferase ChpT
MTRTDLAALIGSRICHDLISPIGALGNGVELLELSQGTSPELALLADSVAQAQARIRLFRLALGSPDAAQRISAREIATIVEGLGRPGKLRFEIDLPADLPRPQARRLMLAVMCVESALAWGGTVTLGASRVLARAARMRLDPPLWAALDSGTPPDPCAAAQVQFALLALSGPVRVGHAPETLTLDLDPDLDRD